MKEGEVLIHPSAMVTYANEEGATLVAFKIYDDGEVYIEAKVTHLPWPHIGVTKINGYYYVFDLEAANGWLFKTRNVYAFRAVR